MHKDELGLNDLISFFSIMGILLSFVMLVGIAGGVDCDTITIYDAAKKGVIWCIILIISVIGVLKVEKDEEEGRFDDL